MQHITAQVICHSVLVTLSHILLLLFYIVKIVIVARGDVAHNSKNSQAVSAYHDVLKEYIVFYVIIQKIQISHKFYLFQVAC